MTSAHTEAIPSQSPLPEGKTAQCEQYLSSVPHPDCFSCLSARPLLRSILRLLPKASPQERPPEDQGGVLGRPLAPSSPDPPHVRRSAPPLRGLPGERGPHGAASGKAPRKLARKHGPSGGCHQVWSLIQAFGIRSPARLRGAAPSRTRKNEWLIAPRGPNSADGTTAGWGADPCRHRADQD